MKKVMKILTCVGMGALIIGCSSDSTKTMVCEAKADEASMKVELEYKDNMVFKETMSVEQKLGKDAESQYENDRKNAEEYYKKANTKFTSSYEDGIYKWSVSLNFKEISQEVADEMNIPLDKKDGVTFVDLDQTITSLEGMGATCK